MATKYCSSQIVRIQYLHRQAVNLMLGKNICRPNLITLRFLFMDLTSKSHNLNNLLDESAFLEIYSTVCQIRDIYYDSSSVYWLTKIKHVQKYYRQAFFKNSATSSTKYCVVYIKLMLVISRLLESFYL